MSKSRSKPKSKFLHVLLTTASIALAAQTGWAQTRIDMDISSPNDLNSANPVVFISFVTNNDLRSIDGQQTSVNIIVNDKATGFFSPATVNADYCSTNATGGASGTYFETCGCYFNLRDVDTNRSQIDIAVQYRNGSGGTGLYAAAKTVIASYDGYIRPPATGPICPPVHSVSVNERPSAIAGRDQSHTGATMVHLDGTASFDPNEDSLTYLWEQATGPAVALNNPTSPTPSFGTSNVAGPVDREFYLTVKDTSGLASLPERIKITTLANTQVCLPWDQDKLIQSLSYTQPNGPLAPYAIKFLIPQTIRAQHDAELQRLRLTNANIKRLEIKTYVINAGPSNATFGYRPSQQVTPVSGVTAKSTNYVHPLSPPPLNFWVNNSFAINNWYRIDTKVNVYDVTNNFVQSYDDSCVYETVYVKLSAAGNFGARFANAFVFSDGINTIPTSSDASGQSAGSAVGIQTGPVTISRDGVRITLPNDITRSLGYGQETEVIIAPPPDTKKANPKKKKRKWRWRIGKKKKVEE